MPELKHLNITVKCEATYTSGIFVPANFTTEEALKYANAHIKDIPAGALTRIQNSETIIKNGCYFDDEIPSIMNDVNHGNMERAKTYFQTIIDAYQTEEKSNDIHFDIYPCSPNGDRWYLILHCQHYETAQNAHTLIDNKIRKELNLGSILLETHQKPVAWTGKATILMYKLKNQAERTIRHD